MSDKIVSDDEQLQSWYTRGRQFKQEGDFANAIVCFQSMVKKAPDEPVGLNELFKCCLLEGREKEGVDAVNALMKIYVDHGKKTEALTVFGELMQLKAGHCFDQDVQIKLVSWLQDVSDMKGAVEALRSYGDRYQHDKRTPELLLQAAQICKKHLKDTEQTEEIANWISERYPDSVAAEEAALLFFETKV